MAVFLRFEEIESWQKARELTKEIYILTNQTKINKDYGLREQIRRACVSIMSNIAEGFERGRKNEFIHFLTIAKGSVGEVRSQLYVLLDQEYISKNEFDCYCTKTEKIGRLINGLITYLESTNAKSK